MSGGNSSHRGGPLVRLKPCYSPSWESLPLPLWQTRILYARRLPRWGLDTVFDHSYITCRWMSAWMCGPCPDSCMRHMSPTAGIQNSKGRNLAKLFSSTSLQDAELSFPKCDYLPYKLFKGSDMQHCRASHWTVTVRHSLVFADFTHTPSLSVVLYFFTPSLPHFFVLPASPLGTLCRQASALPLWSQRRPCWGRIWIP